MTHDDAAQVLLMLADLRRRMPEQSADAQLIEACEAGAKALRQSGWQDIATAPKDGTEVLMRCRNRAGLPGTVVAHYCSSVEDHPPIDATFYFWNGSMFTHVTQPTHWMPLPAPPSVTR